MRTDPWRGSEQFHPLVAANGLPDLRIKRYRSLNARSEAACVRRLS